MARLVHPLDALLAARGLLFPWVPVFLGIGIGGYFSLPAEPRFWGWTLLASAALASGMAAALAGLRWRPAGVALACLFMGVLAAGFRAHSVAAPVLGWRYYGPVEGRIVDIDRSMSDEMRLTLDKVVLARLAPDRTPSRVRVTLHGDQGFLAPEAGMTVILTGNLSPPAGPTEPGGFDFQRMAWFDGIGAVGYTQNPVLLWREAGSGQRITRLRLRISAAVRAAVPGEAGAFAAAMLTGDRSGISRETILHLRASNLAHLLAISGLHMGLLTGFVFAALRTALALIPPLALRLPVKKIAAGLALAAAAFYLVLSGGNVATERAFVMVAVMLGAILFDRRALTLRSVAIAACLILLAQPESLTEPGFQMSFAATTALVASFGVVQTRLRDAPLPGWTAPVVTLLFSSSVAGAATAPIAAATFNRVAEYGLLANMLSVPVMGLLVMPAAVVAAVLAPFGLAAPALWAMELGTRWILFIAGWVASLHGAVVPVPAPPGYVLPALALSALWLILWRGRLRWAGVVVGATCIMQWSLAERPQLLVSEDGRLAGLMTTGGRALSRPKGSGLAARTWLEDDGDAADQEKAAARPGFSGSPGHQDFELNGTRFTLLSGRGSAASVQVACAQRNVVVTPEKGDFPAGCLVLSPRLLRLTGAISVTSRQGGLVFETATRIQGWRPWTPAGRRPQKPWPDLTVPAQAARQGIAQANLGTPDQ